MKKSIVCVILALAILVMPCALAETAKPVKSVTTATLTKPTGSNVTYSEKFTISVVQMPTKPVTPAGTADPSATAAPDGTVPETPVVETTTSIVFAEMTEVAKTAPVTTYFKEETIQAAVEILPEAYNVENLQMDEFFPLVATGYEEDYGDVEAVFEFLTPYEDDQVLLVMVGIVATDEELAAAGIEVVTEADRIIWVPLQAEAVDGMVKITFTQDVMKQMEGHETMMAVLSGDALEAETAQQ